LVGQCGPVLNAPVDDRRSTISIRVRERDSVRVRIARPLDIRHSDRVAKSSEYPRDAGSRTMLDAFFGRKRDPADDIDAVFSRGEGRAVSCFLRSNVNPLPDKFSYGVLRIDTQTVFWSSGFKGNGDALRLQTPLDVRQVRKPGGPGEAGIKQDLFSIIEAASSAGIIELAVPTESLQLVSRRLNTA
jgi:hypothetical protein